MGYNPEDSEELVIGYKHRQKEILDYNEKKLKEIRFDLNNSMVSGSESSVEDITNQYVSFVLVRNESARYADIIEECRRDEEC